MVQIHPSRAKPGRRDAVRGEILRRAADAFREKGFHGLRLYSQVKSVFFGMHDKPLGL